MTRQSPNIFAKIKVVGVGGAGGSAINRMLKAKIPIVKYVAINTDGQALQMIKDKTVKKVRIGRTLTKGSGTGMDPEIGRAAVEEDIAIVKDSLKGADMIFITAGLGGGTSSGAGPVIAELCQQTKALTIAIL
ncbi:cell division protein FtsZ, partial [Patescibacteria group bacterium]|nr:cell division protein FtsZ [Patescibacteria group bacterium]